MWTVAWRFSATRRGWNSTVLTALASALIVATLHAQPAALQPGQKIWEFKTGGAIVSSPALSPEGRVLVGSNDGKVYALDNATGKEYWRFETGAPVASSPALGEDGTVYVGSNDRNLYALNPTTGKEIWRFFAGNEVRSSPAIGTNGRIYIATAGGWFYAVESRTGQKVWEFKVTTSGISSSVPLRPSPAVGPNGTVYVASSGDLSALDGFTGEKKWSIVIANLPFFPSHSSPVVGADGTVYMGDGDGDLRALEGETGKQKWLFEALKAPGQAKYLHSCPAIGPDGTVYVVTWNGALTALDRATGKPRFVAGFPVSRLLDSVKSSPAVSADGTLYFAAQSHQVYAIDGASGTRRWVFQSQRTEGRVEDVYSSPAIGPDGTIHIGLMDGYVYAIKGTVGLAQSPWAKFRQNARNTGSLQDYFKSLPRFDPSFAGFAREGFSLSLESEFGKPYQIEWTSDWRVWTPLQLFTNTPGDALILDRGALSSPHRFYRARAK